MTSKSNKIRNAREANRKFKKKANPFANNKVEFIDYKDVTLLQRFMSDRSKIRSQRMSGTSVQQQHDIANAIKNAREMALLPYTKRVTSTKAPRAGADRREEEATLELDEQPTSSAFGIEHADDADNAIDAVVEATETVEVEAVVSEVEVSS